MMNHNLSIRALACDYDGTLTGEGPVDAKTLAALTRFKASGRKLILVTGRETADLLKVFPAVRIFDSVAAENGAVLYRPETREEIALGPPPAPGFVQQLHARGVTPLSIGKCVVATVRSQRAVVEEAINQTAPDREIVLNRNSLMVLPSGMDKAIGLEAALREIGISTGETAGIGDAENDDAFLRICGLYVAVANAIPTIREAADIITENEDGAGVQELVERIFSGDLAAIKTQR